MGAVRHIPRRSGSNAPAGIERRAWELRLARYGGQARDPGERDALFEHFLPLAHSLAARYRHCSESFDDLLQVASLGLLKAIDRYDATRGYAFSSFAVPTILGELRRHLRDHTWSIRVPRELQELAQRLGPATAELTSRLGRPPTVPELAEHLGVTEEHVLDARQATAARSPASLDQPVGDGDVMAALGELLGAEDRALSTVEDVVLLDRYLARLPARSRGCSACASTPTSSSATSARCSASRRCTSLGSSANRSTSSTRSSPPKPPPHVTARMLRRAAGSPRG